MLGSKSKKAAFPISTKYEVGHSSAHFISFNLLPYLQRAVEPSWTFLQGTLKTRR